ncbi:MAG: glutaredoxin family protein [Solirubrobacterales bacterium]|nr:glutaredoxin family protein [Solirubrobacterales bacterium]
MTRSLPTVTLYGRPDCHLCDEARSELAEMRAAGLLFVLEEIDIESSQELLRRYLELIPVVELNGVLVSELELDAEGLRTRLGTVDP